MKVAGQWTQWSTDQVLEDGRRLNGRAVFHIFLLGNALSIVFAFLGFQTSRWLLAGNQAAAFVASTVMCSVTLAFGLWHRWQSTRAAV